MEEEQTGRCTYPTRQMSVSFAKYQDYIRSLNKVLFDNGFIWQSGDIHLKRNKTSKVLCFMIYCGLNNITYKIFFKEHTVRLG